MSYNSLIRKLLAKEELNILERTELENFDADSLVEEKNDLTRERDQLKSEQAGFKRGEQLRKIAEHFHCSDPDYLDFLASRNDLDLADEKAVRDFVSNMQKNSPHCFYSTVKSGGGTAAPAVENNAGNVEIPSYDRIGRIAASLVHAPEQR